MFAGIIDEKAKVRKITKGTFTFQIAVESKKLSSQTNYGDSIAVNGVCLTVAKVRNGHITFDVIMETLRNTTLARLSNGSPVNLEKSLKLGDKISGHFVTGHIDCLGKIAAISKHPNDYAVTIEIPEEKLLFAVAKGSIAVDGVSLTIADVGKRSVSVCLIPTTLIETTLGTKKVGDEVNIEFDLLSKYALNKKSKVYDRIDLEFLKEHGFA